MRSFVGINLFILYRNPMAESKTERKLNMDTPVRTSRWTKEVDSIRQALFNDDPIKQLYDQLIIKTDQMISSPDSQGKWYYLVFKPFDDSYNQRASWFESSKWLDWVRKRFLTERTVILTVEKYAKKHHVNAIVFSYRDLMYNHDKSVANKCKIHCQEVVNMLTLPTVRDYIFKEAQLRMFHLYHDYYLRSNHTDVAAGPYGAQPDQSNRSEAIGLAGSGPRVNAR